MKLFKNLCTLLFVMLTLVTTTKAQTTAPKIKSASVNAILTTGNDKIPDPAPFAATITAGDLKKHLSILASDEYEGRETGTAGNQKAAEYLAGQFRMMGLPAINDNSYFQAVAFHSASWDRVDMTVNGKTFRHMRQFYSFAGFNSHMPLLEREEVLFLGYGIDDPKYCDYKGVDVRDKVILVYPGEPLKKDSTSWITGNSTTSDWTTDRRKKLRTAKAKGVKAVLIIDPFIKKNISEYRRFLLGSRLSLGEGENPEQNFANSCAISTTVAKEIMGKRFKKVVKARKRIKKRGKSKAVKMKCDFRLIQKKNAKKIAGDNVLGYVEGSDPKLKEEVVIVTAHYDHLGKRGDDIYNGADDNGSGTSSVLEVCQAFSEAKKEGKGPRRSVLFMLVTGEEKGLLGSKYYTEFPLFPLANTVANVNVDMVGRVDEKHKEDPNYIYVIGSDRLSTELHAINEAANTAYTKLELDYTYNAKDDPNRYYYRSDHYNFAEKGIPAIFYFNGTHVDYHMTSDTVEKINFEKMAKIAQLVYHTTWELANRDKKIVVDVIAE